MLCLCTKPASHVNRATRSDWHGEWHGWKSASESENKTGTSNAWTKLNVFNLEPHGNHAIERILCLHTKPVPHTSRATPSDWHGERHGENLYPKQKNISSHPTLRHQDHIVLWWWHSNWDVNVRCPCLDSNHRINYTESCLQIHHNLTGTGAVRGVARSHRSIFFAKNTISAVLSVLELFQNGLWVILRAECACTQAIWGHIHSARGLRK